MPTNSVNIGISIPTEMEQWLDSKEGQALIPNKSKLFQDAVDEKRNPPKRKTQPMTWLVIVMGFSLGIGSMVISRLSIFDLLFSTTLFLLGMLIFCTALVTLVRETRLKQKYHIK